MASTSASQVFRDLTRFFTPTIPVWDDDYDGLEYKWKIFIFRPASEYHSAMSSTHNTSFCEIPVGQPDI